jgi:hypothetical protein
MAIMVSRERLRTVAVFTIWFGSVGRSSAAFWPRPCDGISKTECWWKESGLSPPDDETLTNLAVVSAYRVVVRQKRQMEGSSGRYHTKEAAASFGT